MLPCHWLQDQHIDFLCTCLRRYCRDLLFTVIALNVVYPAQSLVNRDTKIFCFFYYFKVGVMNLVLSIHEQEIRKGRYGIVSARYK